MFGMPTPATKRVLISCVIKDCSFQFVNVNTYYKHVRRYHSKEYFEKQQLFGLNDQTSSGGSLISDTDTIHLQTQQVVSEESCAISSIATEYTENAFNESPNSVSDHSLDDSMDPDEIHNFSLNPDGNLMSKTLPSIS